MEIRRRLHKDKWTIQVLSTKEIERLADGREVLGLCDAENRMIYIHRDSVDYKTISHEIFHAYWSYLHLDDTNNIEVTDVEEIAASFFSSEGEEMVRKAKRITKDLQKRMEE
jgi:hypothetical protein